MPSLPQTSPTRFPKPLSLRKRTAKCKQELSEQLLMKTEPTETEEIGLSTFKGANRARPSQKGFLLSSLKYWDQRGPWHNYSKEGQKNKPLDYRPVSLVSGRSQSNYS